jgi:hypothetical protein
VPVRRTLATLASVVLTVLGVVVLYPPKCVHACSCIAPPGPKKALSSSEAVFSGEVAGIEKKEAATSRHPGTVTVSLRVSEVWKGPERSTLEVSMPSQESACRYPFEEGQEYLVYASGRDLGVSLCSPTKPLSKAGEDLAVLGNGEKPKSNDALTDTSGIVPVRVVVGLAGLAMVASSLVALHVVRTGQVK